MLNQVFLVNMSPITILTVLYLPSLHLYKVVIAILYQALFQHVLTMKSINVFIAHILLILSLAYWLIKECTHWEKRHQAHLPPNIQGMVTIKKCIMLWKTKLLALFVRKYFSAKPLYINMFKVSISEYRNSLNSIVILVQNHSPLGIASSNTSRVFVTRVYHSPSKKSLQKEHHSLGLHAREHSASKMVSISMKKRVLLKNHLNALFVLERFVQNRV